jgi:hypothetical protein
MENPRLRDFFDLALARAVENRICHLDLLRPDNFTRLYVF